jgi:RNase P subunit RPR2
MATDSAELWYEIRDGQPFCKKCNQPLVGQTMKEAFILDAPTEGVMYHCDGCKQNVILPSRS